MNKEIERLCMVAERWYNFNYRPYHNWDHAVDVYRNALKIDTVTDELCLAAHWHDAIYIPGANCGANEYCSSAALKNDSARFNISRNVIARACQLIEYTTIETHLNSLPLRGDIATLLDSDLCRLADPWDDFIRHQDNIIKEYGGNINEDRKKCANFLVNFLHCREHIYHTDFMRTHVEAKAKANIERFFAEYGE